MQHVLHPRGLAASALGQSGPGRLPCRCSPRQGVHARVLHPGVQKSYISRVPVRAAEPDKGGQRHGPAHPTADVLTANASSGTCLSSWTSRPAHPAHPQWCPQKSCLQLLKVCGAGAEHSCLWRASEHASSSYTGGSHVVRAHHTDFPNLLTLCCMQLQGSLALQAEAVPRRRADIVGCSGKLSTCYMPPPLARLQIGLIDLHQLNLTPAVLCRPAAAIPSPLMSIARQ